VKTLHSLSELPTKPSVYAMYGGRGRGQYCAYVGIADNLKRRVMQHLVRRDSSIATGTSAVVLNPDYVTEVRWWEHEGFSERPFLEAAELVAFDLLQPALRSRGATQEQARQLYGDGQFRERMRSLFSGDPNGRAVILTLQDALERIAALEKKVEELEAQLLKCAK
jgi:hypothetical protein